MRRCAYRLCYRRREPKSSGSNPIRYYRVVVTNTDGTVISPPGFAGLLGGATYTSFVNGQTLDAAWDCELDIPVIDAATSQGFGLLRIWGISNQEISQANNLNGKNIAVFAGMAKGLPLANPAQAGLLVQGSILQCFGNNIGVDRTLDFVISNLLATASSPGGIGTLKTPKNIVLNWKAGQTLATALATTLATAFPGVQQSIAISNSIVRPSDDVSFFPTLELLAQYCRQVSFDIVKTSGYAGVSIVPSNGAIAVYDGSSPQTQTTMIAFQDLIGQPTWIDNGVIQFKTVMRADLNLTSSKGIMLPPTQIINTAAANSYILNQQLTFQGGFDLISARHVGHFRQPSADAWCSIFEAAPRAPQ
jgi:hypothetical protein